MPISTKVVEALQALGEGTERSMTSRLADYLPHIESALSKGVKREQIVKALKDDGLVFSIRSFDATLYKLRKRAQRLTVSVEPSAPKTDQQAPSTANHGSSDGAAERSFKATPPTSSTKTTNEARRAKANKYVG
jgi:hypothetical protein